MHVTTRLRVVAVREPRLRQEHLAMLKTSLEGTSNPSKIFVYDSTQWDVLITVFTTHIDKFKISFHGKAPGFAGHGPALNLGPP
jgi:hypothetical protein